MTDQYEMFYSKQDFKDGCWFNFILGFFSGIAFIVITGLLFAYFHGWIW